MLVFRLLLLDRSVPAVSPPPTYRSNSASLVRYVEADLSRCTLIPTYLIFLQTNLIKNREIYFTKTKTDLSVYVVFSRGSHGAAWCGSEYSGPPSYRAPRSEPAVTVTDTLPSLNPLDLKYADDAIEALPKPTEQEKDPDEHLVTIVHTDNQPVIVTVSGSPALNDTHTQPPSEIDILAHL